MAPVSARENSVHIKAWWSAGIFKVRPAARWRAVPKLRSASQPVVGLFQAAVPALQQTLVQARRFPVQALDPHQRRRQPQPLMLIRPGASKA
jgi:hypothetical protein